MKLRNVLVLSISLILSASVLAQQGQPVFMPAANLKWTDLDPKGAPGVGTYIQVPEGKAEVRMSPGSYMMQPGGVFHVSPQRREDAEVGPLHILRAAVKL